MEEQTTVVGEPQLAVRAVITIVLMPDGQIHGNFQGEMTRDNFNVMMARAQQDILPALLAAERPEFRFNQAVPGGL